MTEQHPNLTVDVLRTAVGSGLDSQAEKYHDGLTGLHNFQWLKENLPVLLENYPGNVSVVAMDIDGLKRVNDDKGHAAGDDLIRDAGHILSKTLRTHPQESNADSDRRQYAIQGEKSNNDFIAVRRSGDEFFLVLPGVKEDNVLATIISRVEEGLTESAISASIDGRVHVAGESAEDLLLDVDMKMYKKKMERRLERINALPIKKRVAFKVGSTLLRYSGFPSRS